MAGDRSLAQGLPQQFCRRVIHFELPCNPNRFIEYDLIRSGLDLSYALYRRQ